MPKVIDSIVVSADNCYAKNVVLLKVLGSVVVSVGNCSSSGHDKEGIV